MFRSELVCNAYALASHGYSSQPLRKDGTSQLSHCVLAALTLADLGLDERAVAAALLHEFLRPMSGMNTSTSSTRDPLSPMMASPSTPTQGSSSPHLLAFRSQLEEFMPSDVVRLVDDVSTISEVSQMYRKAHQEQKGQAGEEAGGGVDDETLRRMVLAMEDVRAVLVKLACRVHNMKTIQYLSPEKQQVFAQETLDIFSVVANRLGCWCLKAELEDRAFR